MGISFDEHLGIHQQALLYREQRATVISGNLANIDTPGYKAVDLDFSTALQQAREGKNLNNGQPTATPQMVERPQSQPSADGNTVEIGQEQAAWARNRTDWETSFTFLNMKFKSLEKAISGQ
ncbi:flagellar basal body rod protein FlgB [Parendozoicomonas haliclonae]|uniref:Flagellar basal body rod protein FlgB n=1 Tax=Parendozoicomonas haliclonae TaxID=1960125 RepID=A0A1X7ANJ1_9GAMM|nr:flagellar basal body rod protein FlgB [Parendozoicomonas haliclonae]SMA49650.1 Flagellar basal body rod protein FlgB [Parendozoicomonas haliclonae]